MKKALALGVSFVLLCSVVGLGTAAWYTKITNVTGMTFDVAKYDFNADTVNDDFIIDVSQYVNVKTNTAAPGTSGIIPIYVSATEATADVNYTIGLDTGDMAEEFRDRLRFYYYTQADDYSTSHKLVYNSLNTGERFNGSLHYDGSSVSPHYEYIYWEWVYEYDINEWWNDTTDVDNPVWTYGYDTRKMNADQLATWKWVYGLPSNLDDITDDHIGEVLPDNWVRFTDPDDDSKIYYYNTTIYSNADGYHTAYKKVYDGTNKDKVTTSDYLAKQTLHDKFDTKVGTHDFDYVVISGLSVDNYPEITYTTVAAQKNVGGAVVDFEATQCAFTLPTASAGACTIIYCDNASYNETNTPGGIYCTITSNIDGPNGKGKNSSNTADGLYAYQKAMYSKISITAAGAKPISSAGIDVGLLGSPTAIRLLSSDVTASPDAVTISGGAIYNP